MARWILLSLLLTGVSVASAEVPQEPRQAVTMPALQQALLQQEMIQHTATLQQLIALLGEGNLTRAAELAESQLGLSSMGKHAAATRGMGPGRFFPDPMRAIGIGMHEAASDFAAVAREGDGEASLQALAPVLGACVSCHAGYRLE